MYILHIRALIIVHAFWVAADPPKKEILEFFDFIIENVLKISFGPPKF